MQMHHSLIIDDDDSDNDDNDNNDNSNDDDDTNRCNRGRDINTGQTFAHTERLLTLRLLL